MLDTTPLRDSCSALLEAAKTVADVDTTITVPAGEWNADQILAHVSIVTATTIAAAYAVASGTNTTYDNRIALDTWTINHVIELAGGNAGLRERIRQQADVLCELADPVLSETELDTPIPTRLLSNDTVLVDQLVPLRDLITGLADAELPGHAQQLLALLSNRAEATT